MPTGTRITTPLPRSYISDERLNNIDDPLAREAFFRAKLICDNLGRLPGNPATVAGTLYPANPPTSEQMTTVIRLWVEAGLAFHYQVGKFWFIEITDTGGTQKIVGNMSERSEFPEPPREMIAAWEQEFACQWYPVRRKGDDAESEPRKNPVHTPSKQSIAESGQVRSSRVGLGSVEGGQAADAADPVGSPSSEENDLDFDLHDHRNLEVLERTFGLLGFDHGTGFGKKTFTDFQKVVLFVRQDWTGEVAKSLTDMERFMTSVMDECENRHIEYPSGWVKVVTQFRKSLKR